jgi:hypothetical protein
MTLRSPEEIVNLFSDIEKKTAIDPAANIKINREHSKRFLEYL